MQNKSNGFGSAIAQGDDEQIGARRLRDGYEWSERTRGSYHDAHDRPWAAADGAESWSGFAQYVADNALSLPNYWKQASLWVINQEIVRRLAEIGVELLVKSGHNADHWLDAGPQGQVHLFLEPRSGSEADLIATRQCPRCGTVCRSLPITNEVHLVSFVEGYDAPCTCVKTQTGSIDREIAQVLAW